MSLEIIKKISEEAVALQNKMHMEETFHRIIALVEAEFVKIKAAVITKSSAIVNQPIVVSTDSTIISAPSNPVSNKEEIINE